MDTIARIDAFFAGRAAQWALFDALARAVLGRFPSAHLRVMKTCIAFDDPKPFIYVSFPPKKSMGGLMLSISLRERRQHPRFCMVVPVSPSRFTAHIHLPEEAQINDELLALIAYSRR